tara:strand:- start:6036 stop:6191 length:156 start_codon:yes stop_codon:yes gene_type:complete
MTSIWIMIFYFFSEAIIQSDIYSFISIVILIILISAIAKKYLSKFEAPEEK